MASPEVFPFEIVLAVIHQSHRNKKETKGRTQMEYSLVYITTQDKHEAQKIGKDLVQSRLAACCNILAPMTSMYWWEGKVQEDEEAVLIVKTTKTQLDPLIQRVLALHSYDEPCVVCLPIEHGSKTYLDWIAQETTQAKV